MSHKQDLKTILYVEDDVDIQQIALLALEHVGGYSVSLASSGQEALAVVSKIQPDLVLLDMMMPGMDGLTTLQGLRANSDSASIPVIFMTAKVQDQEIKHYLEAGACGVIAKPFDPMQLAEQVRTIWQQSQR
jgi:CheY-like chemotaxis protein